MQWTDEQRRDIDRIVAGRLARQQRVHDRELRIQREAFERELERVRLELRAERGLIMRIRQWLSA